MYEMSLNKSKQFYLDLIKLYYCRYYCSELLASQKVQKLRSLDTAHLKNIYENLPELLASQKVQKLRSLDTEHLKNFNENIPYVVLMKNELFT